MDLDITRLKELAQAATPGPWYVVTGKNIGVGPCPGRAVAVCNYDNGPIEKANAAFIAALYPAAILELIERLELAQTGSFGGYVIEHADGDRWRTLDHIGMPDWTNDKAEALRFALRKHADAFASDDPEDVRIVALETAPNGWVMVPREVSDHPAFLVSQCFRQPCVMWKDAYRNMISVIKREYPSPTPQPRVQPEEQAASLVPNGGVPTLTREHVCALLDVCRDKMREINAVYEKLLAGEATALPRDGVQL